jgi:putative tryptophan/tyrosine transport system substrate-binding protein
MNYRGLFWAFALLGVIGTVICILSVYRKEENDKFRVAIVSIVEIEPIAQLREGFRETFLSSDFAKSHNVVVTEFNAQGDSALVNQIADRIATDPPDVVYVLGTPAAQAIQKRSPDVLLVQGAATDPVEAGLADSWDGSGRKYVATSDLPPVRRQLELIAKLTPKVRRLGVIYNPGESNSVAVVARLRQAIVDTMLPITLVERAISKTGDVAEAAQSLATSVDAIYLPPDNTAHAAIPVVGRIARDHRIAFYATVVDALEHHALATMALDFTELGRESAMMVLDVLRGSDPATIPIRTSDQPTIWVNKKMATLLDIDLTILADEKRIEIVE